MPFTFPTDANTKAGAVRSIRGGADFVVPVSPLSGEAVLLTSAALGAAGTYTQTGQSRFSGILVGRVRGYALTDQAGTLYVEESTDGSTWSTIASVAVTANALTDTGWVPLTRRDYRFRYTNGATAQTAFLLYEAIAAAADDPPGWTWAKIVAAAAGDQTVKERPGKVAKLYVETASISVYLKDGANQAWASVTGAGGQDFAQPLSCSVDIRLNFSAAGTAWVLYI